MISHTISLPIVGISVTLYNGDDITFLRVATMVVTGISVGLLAGLVYKFLGKNKRKVIRRNEETKRDMGI